MSALKVKQSQRSERVREIEARLAADYKMKLGLLRKTTGVRDEDVINY